MAVILDNKEPRSPSVFRPEALLREARRQKGIPSTRNVPAICILDPDGDVVRTLRESGSAKGFSGWPCYHTELDTFLFDGRVVGIVGRVVGASFAVLVAEELFASGCRLLISLTSAGQIMPAGEPPYLSSLSALCATRERAIITPRRRNSRKRTRHLWRRPPLP